MIMFIDILSSESNFLNENKKIITQKYNTEILELRKINFSRIRLLD